MAKDFPDLGQYDDRWTIQDQTELDFLRHKYGSIPQITADTEPEWMGLRKLAEKNRLREDGTPNPHYLRMKMEADMSRLQYEFAVMMRVNSILFEQVQILNTLYERVGLLEGAYSHLRTGLDNARDVYRTSIKKHYEDRREWHTQDAMRRAGLDPDKKEDRLRWANHLDDLAAKAFGHFDDRAVARAEAKKKFADEDRIDYHCHKPTIEEQDHGITEGSNGADGQEGDVLPREAE